MQITVAGKRVETGEALKTHVTGGAGRSLPASISTMPWKPT